MSTRYNTGNPIESTDVRDMSDNAKNLDLFSNSSELSFDDRLGIERKTINGMNSEFDGMIVGMNSEFDAQILNMGFTGVGTFLSGATLTNPRQTLLWDIADGGDGQEYGWSGAFHKVVPPLSTPNTTGGIAVGAWMSRFDPSLRAALTTFIGDIDAAASWDDVPSHSDPELGGALNAQALALAERTEFLRVSTIRWFNAVADMKNDMSLRLGQVVGVLFKLPRGTYQAHYLIRNDITVDGYGDHGLANGLKAELIHNGELQAEVFGLAPDDSTKAAQNVTVMKQCILYAYNKKPMNSIGGLIPYAVMALQFNTPIAFGPGEFYMDGNSPFRVNKDLLLNNQYRRGLRMRGAGRKSTVFTMLEHAAGTQDRWFYDTEEYASRGGIDFLQWQDFSLQSYKPAGTELDTVPAGRKVGAIRAYSTGFEKFFDFENVTFNSLDKVTYLSGSANADENHFRNCRFDTIRDAVGHFENNQVVDTVYSNCEFEILMGDVFLFGGEQAGGNITVSSGSIIMNPKFVGGVVDTTQTRRKAVFRYEMSATGFSGLRSDLHKLKNVTFEIYDDLAKLVVFERSAVGSAVGAFDVVAEDCSWHTVMRKTGSGTIVDIPDTDPPVDLVYVNGLVSASVKLKRCHLHPHHRYTLAGATGNYAAQSLFFENSYLLWEAGHKDKPKSLSSLVYLSDKSSARAENTHGAQGPESSGTRSISVAHDFDMHSNNGQPNLDYPAKARLAMVHSRGVAWGSGLIPKALLPVGSFITAIRINIPAVSGGSASSCFVSINNGKSYGADDYVEYYRTPFFNNGVGYSKWVTLDAPVAVNSPGWVGAAHLNSPLAIDLAAFIQVEYSSF